MSIRFDGLSVALGRRPVLHDLSATLESGRLVGIIGPNGAGKSTLARALLALVRYGGSIQIDGHEASTLPRAEIARRIAYLPQGQLLHWPLTVERLVGLGRLPYLAPLSRLSSEDEAAIDRAMARTDVLSLAQRSAIELSGGERVRVLMARALAVEAPALIADEPLTSLDPGHQFDVMDLLKAEAASGALVVAVLHDLTMAARYCDRLILLGEGRIVGDGAPAQVLTQSILAQVYGIDASLVQDGDGLSLSVQGRRRA